MANVFDDDVSEDVIRMRSLRQSPPSPSMGLEAGLKYYVVDQGLWIDDEDSKPEIPQREPDFDDLPLSERDFTRKRIIRPVSPETFFDPNYNPEMAEINSLFIAQDLGKKEHVEYLEDVIKKLQSEIKSSNRFHPLDIVETIQRISTSKPYTLELYKSIDVKLALLDHAILLHDGNAITAVTLFIKNTLSLSKFISSMKTRASAARHYLSYLKSRFEHTEMLSFYTLMGQKEAAAMIAYKIALTDDSSIDARIANLHTCYNNYFKNVASLSSEAGIIQEQIALLERQRPIEVSDFEAEKSGKVRQFVDHPRSATILNMSLITTLYYCAFYHIDKGENHLASPYSIKKQHKLMDKQFYWPMLNARARLKCWHDIESLSSTKGYFGKIMLKPPIALDKVAGVLHKFGAPADILSIYLKDIDDLEKKLTLAKQYKCHQLVVDILVSLKNKDELIAYKANLPLDDRAYFYAQSSLNNSNIRWKP